MPNLGKCFHNLQAVRTPVFRGEIETRWIRRGPRRWLGRRCVTWVASFRRRRIDRFFAGRWRGFFFYGADEVVVGDVELRAGAFKEFAEASARGGLGFAGSARLEDGRYNVNGEAEAADCFLERPGRRGLGRRRWLRWLGRWRLGALGSRLTFHDTNTGRSLRGRSFVLLWRRW